MKDERNYSLLAHNTFGIDAQCRRFLEYANTEEAMEVADILRGEDEREPLMVVGKGSNLLLTTDYEGTVVHGAIRGISMLEEGEEATLSAGCGETWDDVVAWTVERGYADLANLSLIPGEVGASAIQNIGAYGAEAAQFISEVAAIEIATGKQVRLKNEDCRYGYRDSRFKHEWRNKFLVTHVVYHLNRSHQPRLDYGNIRQELEREAITHPTPSQLRQAIIRIRQAKLPEPDVLGNAGSFFMNPVVSRQVYERLAERYPLMPHYDLNEGDVKIPAGWLIDQCGWKGRQMGRAGVYEKQALVLVNLGGATGKEVVELCQAIQLSVKQLFGIELKPEVNIV